ncbi:minor capsid protein [Glutamicibacter nicotianae]|uniref:minor capsid protein n=1 Tax=Glutamicibacter nicotianae TaxID=37929 RepID=UPI001EF970A6|nr:minor capsid protein [Glutamicibacter nicotianae]MBM7767358.1 hypothetical protein [Glutamicibacter nicotianae]
MAKGWKLKTNPVIPRLRNASGRGLGLAAEHVLGESNKIIPHEEGTLQNTGATSVDTKNLRAAVSYNTPYAVVQHEDLSLRHDEGRQAKFLETALASEKDAVREIVRRTIAGEF